MSKRIRILVGGILLLLMSINQVAAIYAMFIPHKGSYNGISASWMGVGDPSVTDVDPDGPGRELQVGDALIAINGMKIRENPSVLIDAPPTPPGTRETLTIRRGGELRDVIIQSVPYKFQFQFDPTALVVALFLMTAWIVFLLRPDDKQAWLLILMLATLTGLVGVGERPADKLPSWFSDVNKLARILGTLVLPIFVHFFLIFPGVSPLLRRYARLEILLYVPYLLMILPSIGLRNLSFEFAVSLNQFRWMQWYFMTTIPLVVAYLAAGLVCLVINYRAASPLDRRRLRVVMAGSGAGFFNFFLIVVGSITGLVNRMGALSDWLEWATFITFPLIPLSFVYAIVRHKVIPIGLIIRRGIRYLLVSRGSILVVLAIVGVVMYFVMDTFFYYLNPRSGRTVGIISAILAIVVWQGARAFHQRVVAPKIDKIFFHQAYDTRQVIAELTESLRATTSREQLLELVATRIQSALQSANVTILLRDEETGDFETAYSCLYSFHNRSVMKNNCKVRLTGHMDVMARMAKSGEPIDLEGGKASISLVPEVHDSTLATGVTPAESQDDIQKLESSLLLPITCKAGLLGVISVGPHLGDLPFSTDDKRLLLSVGGPTSFALENIQLIERTIEDARRRQELEAENEHRARELEGARQLQLSMLPKSIPQPPHLEIAVYMKPAAEVGGDYYDFHLADDGSLTIAVGDATGHGLKAGTVVTVMKTLFRTFAAEPEIIPILNRSSRVLKEMNLRSLFMGLTMIKLDGVRLKISSAGMPPMLIFRAETRTVEEVLIKAMPLGSVNGYPYRERELTLGCGDVVLLMSDGLPERFNPAGEMFDYSRTVETLALASDYRPQEVIEHLVSAGDAWAEGRPQDDDITFVVLKVKLAPGDRGN